MSYEYLKDSYIYESRSFVQIIYLILCLTTNFSPPHFFPLNTNSSLKQC